MNIQTVYIVPAMTDLAGQCRIVARAGEVDCARDDYRANPDAWKEIGLMNSRGKLVCLTAAPAVVDEMKSCEPLMAGLVFEFDHADLADELSDDGCYTSSGQPVKCPACGSTNIVATVEAVVDLYQAHGPTAEASYACADCSAPLAYWAYGSFDIGYQADLAKERAQVAA